MESDSQLSIYVRRWRPSRYSFDEVEELVVDEMSTVSDLKSKVINPLVNASTASNTPKTCLTRLLQ